MNILEQIIAHKKNEVAERETLYPAKLLERSLHFKAPTVSLSNYITRKDKSGIIAEIKRKSPSKGIINKYASIEKTSIGYMQAGASALSVLTDELFFGGQNSDLTIARKYNYCPILRKDFIINEYQVIEARSIGADAILLIASVLPAQRIKEIARFARSFQLEVILEIHSRKELKAINPFIDIIGVNNRDLSTFKTDFKNSIDLLPYLPSDFVKISESGITTPHIASELIDAGYDGLLIGEQFMRNSLPERSCGDFIKQLKQPVHEN
ncbi:MAG TPA: indole-3-glycerol phosphate synthase TrpC [Flavipsychrobacter sp.]|nr:indole-3-glycerol phosphate synthase TrpC [Flavipsychrobacter sp.]